MTITPTRQRNAVSEGIAFGLVLLGHPNLPFNKVKVDLAFVSAWRNWRFASSFPQVSTDLRKGLDGVHAMTRADHFKHTTAFYWDDFRRLTIHHRQSDWDPNDPDDIAFAVSVIDGEVPVVGWTELAQAFLDRYLRHLKPTD